MDTAELDALAAEVLCILRAHPAGLSEHGLMAALAAREVPAFRDRPRGDPEALYRAHFLLFHILYRLRQRLGRHGETVEIHCLGIRIVRARPTGGNALAEPDPAAAYYLDLDNLGLDPAAIARLLDAGARLLDGAQRRREALAILDLADPVSDRAIKRRYRALVMRHHPDRGGDDATVQRLNDAMALLGL